MEPCPSTAESSSPCRSPRPAVKLKHASRVRAWAAFYFGGRPSKDLYTVETVRNALDPKPGQDVGPEDVRRYIMAGYSVTIH